MQTNYQNKFLPQFNKKNEAEQKDIVETYAEIHNLFSEYITANHIKHFDPKSLNAEDLQYYVDRLIIRKQELLRYQKCLKEWEKLLTFSTEPKVNSQKLGNQTFLPIKFSSKSLMLKSQLSQTQDNKINVEYKPIFLRK